jgi:uncharacterized protein (TIGR03437 family)
MVIGANFGTVPGSVSVQVGGKSAFVLQATGTSMDIQIPVELAPGKADVVVTRLNLVSLPFSITLEAFAPGIYVKDPAVFISNPNAIGEGVFAGADLRTITTEAPASPGEAISLFAVGLGATNPVVPTGTVAPADPLATTVTLPRVTVAGQETTVLLSALVPGQIGRYQVIFTVPGGLEVGSYPVKLEIGGIQSNTVTLPVGKPTPQITSIVNAASFRSSGLVVPGSIVSLFGANFGTKDILTGFPATDFGGVSVTFNGIPAPLFHLIGSRNQINLLAPVELPESGFVTVQLRAGSLTSFGVQVKMAPVLPAIFFISDPSNPVRRTAAALLAGTAWRAMPQEQARALGIPDNCSGLPAIATCGQPAQPGDSIQVYATGLGKATPGGDPAGRPLATGSVAPADGSVLYVTVRKPVVTVGGVPAQVQFSGLAPGFAGLYQVNLQIPPGAPAGDDVAVTISMPDGPSDTATIAIRR